MSIKIQLPARKRIKIHTIMSINIQLPDEIITVILSRLPVDSVIECKRVCKTWRSLIDDPTFVDTHTRYHIHSSSNSDDHDDDDAVTKIFFLQLTSKLKPHVGFHRRPHNHPYAEFHFGKYINAVDEIGFKLSKALSNIFDEDLTQMRKMIIGSSNGLICFESRQHVYVYNPVTSEYVNLGHPIFKTSIILAADYKYGFGYHPYTNEYKIVVVYYSQKDRKQVSVYTLGSGKWRSQKEEELSNSTCQGFWRLCNQGVLMNGALHWLRTINNVNHYAIDSFDLADEKFRSNIIMTSVPDVAPPSAPNILYGADLDLLGGCLCMTQHNWVSKSSDIWVMNNRDKLWTMKFRIRHKNKYVKYYSPIARLGTKLLLLCRRKRKTSETIASYDTETGNIDYDIVRVGLKYPDTNYYIKFETIPYVKSFVSLKALGEEGAKNVK